MTISMMASIKTAWAIGYDEAMGVVVRRRYHLTTLSVWALSMVLPK